MFIDVNMSYENMRFFCGVVIKGYIRRLKSFPPSTVNLTTVGLNDAEL